MNLDPRQAGWSLAALALCSMLAACGGGASASTGNAAGNAAGNPSAASAPVGASPAAAVQLHCAP